MINFLCLIHNQTTATDLVGGDLVAMAEVQETNEELTNT